jgi:AAA+ superfamily predicted ATPase
LHYLTGVQHVDERLVSLLEPFKTTEKLVPTHQAIAERIASTWKPPDQHASWPVILLCGRVSSYIHDIAAVACASVGLGLLALPAEAVRSSPTDLNSLIRLCDREAALRGSALLINCGDDYMDPSHECALNYWVERAESPLIVASRERRRVKRPALSFEVGRPVACEQRAVWEAALGDLAQRMDGQVDTLISQFSLSAPAIRLAAEPARGEHDVQSCYDALWEACRKQARPRLEGLAQRIEPAAAWDDLVLPEAQKEILRDIITHVRQRTKVYERWGFARKSSRGLGISALFAGASGTGKTMAAEVLAGQLQLDLYRIDLSSVVSKYIGETEKNLRRVFDAAEGGAAILLFDEADALFGKRSEVKDSHDRYANIEISYLLQRMECYRGLAILTTNMKSAVDPAFLRRIRFILHFPFPDAAQRAEIWRRIFPSDLPTKGLHADRLARLNVAGGNIHNIALSAAFLAADAQEEVNMSHALRAARLECAKLEKSLTESEIDGWL